MTRRSTDASAGAAWSIRPSAATEIDITTPRCIRPIDGICLHRQTLPADELTTHDSLRITTPSRTILDLAPSLTDARLEGAIAKADELELDFTPSLQALLERHSGHRGAARLRRVLARIEGRGGSARRLRSDLEAAFLDFALDERWDPQPETNFWIETPAGGYECDAVWPRARLVVELDSREFHDDWRAAERDRRKDRALTVAGWTVIRVTARMLTDGRAALVADLESLISGCSRLPSVQPVPPRRRS